MAPDLPGDSSGLPGATPDVPDDTLDRLGLASEGGSARWTTLIGGVSSDIWRVDLDDRTVCVKRARPKLAVEAEWRAPVERNEAEVAWFEVAGAIDASWVPSLVGQVPDAHLFAMEYLDPSSHPVWKAELAAGRVDVGLAAAVGHRLGVIHGRTANDHALRKRFANDELFRALRADPYFGATATVHAALAPALEALSTRTMATKVALVHGDVSPKNILVGPNGPVFLDAECAWFGDPAFDVAFCLTHLLLKCRWVPDRSDALLRSADALAAAHLEHVEWEPRRFLETRVASLLPALLLARIDGKSPVEYVTDDSVRDSVRSLAHDLIVNPVDTVADMTDAWKASLDQ